jgi:cytochrome o ubiquinol oxidase subunit 2
MNGMATQLHLQADEPGTFQGLSSHFSGDGFSDMHFELRALAPADFAAWTDATRRGGGTLGEAGYTALARQSRNAPKATFASVEADLFRKVVMLQIAPGVGPEPRPRLADDVHKATH